MNKEKTGIINYEILYKLVKQWGFDS